MNKKSLIAILLILTTVVSTFAALQMTTLAQPFPVPCTIRVRPSVADAEVCTNFVVDVDIEDFFLWGVYDYEFLLNYPAAEMDAIIAYDGDFLVEPVAFFWSEPAVGQVFCQGVTTAGGATGSGTLASIEFHCTGAGSSAITLEFIEISDVTQTHWIPDNVIPSSVNQYEGPPAIVTIDPPTYTVPICVQFAVSIKVKDVIDLHSYDLDLSYTNTAVVDCLDIQDAGFIPQPVIVNHKNIDDAAGTITFSVTSTQPFGASGSGAIATITFHCTGAGESTLNIDQVTLYDSAGLTIPRLIGPSGRVIQVGTTEPVKLQHLVEWAYPYYLVDIPFFVPFSPEGYLDVMAALTDKGYTFDPLVGGTASEVHMFIGEEEYIGNVTSWWSVDTLEDGTRACMLSFETEDESDPGMAMGFVTNLLPPEQVPEVDPYIIVNAQPYIFIDFYWWAWTPIGRVVRWPYWWYDSHSHPNWFWGPYWWWRTYTKSYYYPYIDIPYWRPTWGWWWHWTYWHHWYWWSTYFPYDP